MSSIEIGPSRPVGSVQASAAAAPVTPTANAASASATGAVVAATNAASSSAQAASAQPTVATSDATRAGDVPVDMDRVAKIRRAIEQGTYPVIPTRIADAMIAAGMLLRTPE